MLMNKTFSYTLSHKTVTDMHRQLFLRFYFWRLVVVTLTGLVGVFLYVRYRGHWLTVVMITVSVFGWLQLLQYIRYWRKKSRYWVDKSVTVTLCPERIVVAVGERSTTVPYNEISMQKFATFWLLYFSGSSDYVPLLTAVLDEETRNFLLQK